MIVPDNCPITCVICAYKTSSYLEECILSLINQTVHPQLFIITSTPNSFITEMANKYKIPVYINPGQGGLQNDWNFAYQTAQTPYVTICHHDDIYEPTYVEELLKNITNEKNNDIILLHTRWKMLKKGKKSESICSLIHWGLNNIVKFFPSNRWIRLRMLSLGQAIKTPSICYNKRMCPPPLYDSHYQFALDWDTTVKLARKPGKFIYINKPVFSYRVSKEAQTYAFTQSNQRRKEDLKMFCSLWPRPIAYGIAQVYKLAYIVYR